jgi:hypothetical protein
MNKIRGIWSPRRTRERLSFGVCRRRPRGDGDASCDTLREAYPQRPRAAAFSHNSDGVIEDACACPDRRVGNLRSIPTSRWGVLAIESIDGRSPDERRDRGTHIVSDGGMPHSSIERCEYITQHRRVRGSRGYSRWQMNSAASRVPTDADFFRLLPA